MKRKLCFFVLTTFFASAAAAQHEQHAPPKAASKAKGAQEQSASHHSSHHKTKQAVMQVAQVPDKLTLKMRVGVLNLPANTDHMAATQLENAWWPVPFDGWITAYHPRLVDAQGNTVPGRLLHHVAFWNASRSDFLCPNKEEHIFGAGGEMNDWPALAGFGYRVRKGDRIRVDTMFHNPTATDYPQVWLEVEMEYQLLSVAELKSVYPVWFDVQRCGSSGYDLAAGPSVTTGDFTLKHSGVLLGVGGHMHDFGAALELKNDTRRETVATLPSKLNDRGEIQSMPIVTFAERGGYPLAAGEKITVTARYDNRTGKLLPEGAMGIVVGYFLPADDSQMAAYVRPTPPTKRASAARCAPKSQ